MKRMMKRTMKETGSNKGMALVTVLIAIMFIGILATSMMYMSYMNYAAKSVRYSSTDNFYTAEYGLADLSTALQNKAANASTVEEAFSKFTSDNIDTEMGVSHILTTYGGIKCYDCYALETLIQRASQESKIEVFTSEEYASEVYPAGEQNRWPKTQNYILDTKSITFLGVKIRSTTSDGFVSTITTDIKITFDSSTGDLDVNDFSVISDSSLTLDNKDVIFSGNIYIGKQSPYVDSGTEYALAVKNISIVTLLSKRAIINGNVLVKSGCTLIMSGSTTVYGKIVVENGATLIVTGDLVHKDILDVKTGGIVKGISESHAADPTLTEVPVDGDGDGTDDGLLATAILTSVYVKKDSSGGTWQELTIDQFQNANGGLPNPYKEYKSSDDSMSVWFGTIHPSNGISDALVLNGSKPVQIRGDARNVTVVSINPVEYYGEHQTTYMNSLSDEDYDKAKNILISGSGQISGFDGNYSFAGGTLGDDVTFPLTGADDSYVISTPNPVAGTSGRTVYFKDYMNYVPAGYFIAENASTLISQAFSTGGGEADPKNSSVSYTRWTKE